MAIHVPLNIHDARIDIYLFIDVPERENRAKAEGLAPFLHRMPVQHVQRALAKYRIFIIKDKPARGPGGGTWRPGEVRGAFWDKERITGVSNADLQSLILDYGMGLIGVPQDRWQRTLSSMKFTILHEAGHSVDYELNLTPAGVALEDYRGVTPACGAGSLVKRRAVEAYARFILAPSRICRESVSGEDASECNSRLIGLLRRSPAFSSVLPSWRPGL